MFRFLVLAMFVALTSAFMAPVMPSKLKQSKITMGGGPGSGDHGEGGRSKFGGEATRDPEPTVYDPNDPKGKQQAIHKAESFAEYLAKRGAGGGAAPAEASAAAPAAGASGLSDWDGIWGFDRQKEIFLAWDPESPRTYTNFNPFERNLDGAKADSNGCFPGESRGYQPPNRPDVSYAQMQEEKVKLDELAQHPNWGKKGCPGCYSLKWQNNLGAPP
jgi:hypothetical protein